MAPGTPRTPGEFDTASPRPPCELRRDTTVMSPRPRKVSDDEVFAATYRAMSRLGPSELTLAAIAEEAGVTAGALVQRFGSKRDLLLALSGRYANSTTEMFAGLKTAARSPMAAIRAYADCLAQMAVSPAALARSLSYLQIDLTDPDFRPHLEVQARCDPFGAGRLDRGRDRIPGAHAPDQRAPARADDRGGARRLDDGLGALSGGKRRRMDETGPGGGARAFPGCAKRPRNREKPTSTRSSRRWSYLCLCRSASAAR